MFRRFASHGMRTLRFRSNNNMIAKRSNQMLLASHIPATTLLHKRRFTKTLHEKMLEVVPREQDRISKIFAATKDKEISKVTVQQAFQGMRGVKSLICETSELDTNEGIRFRGLTIPDVQSQLPGPHARNLDGEYPLPEGMIWLLLTGEVPTEDEVRQLSEELTSEPRISVPKHVRRIIDDLPVHQHPMSQFTTALLAMQTESKFAQAYADGVHRSKYWEYALDDALNLIARIPHITARIYRQCFRDGNMPAPDTELDWSANWCNMIGLNNLEVYELMRMYFTIHTDHEGGNVSAHAGHLIGSALADPYLAMAGSLCGLAGPLHGLANQESLRFIRRIKRLLGDRPATPEFIEKFVIDLLESGQVVPGFGHAVLRVTDPRYTIQREFALKFLKNDEMFQIVSLLYEIVPPILKEWKGGKIANPWPNLDAHSGSLLYAYGLKEDNFYTVLFGMSRTIGVMSQYVIDRYLGAPIERPKSVTTELIAREFGVTVDA